MVVEHRPALRRADWSKFELLGLAFSGTSASISLTPPDQGVITQRVGYFRNSVRAETYVTKAQKHRRRVHCATSYQVPDSPL